MIQTKKDLIDCLDADLGKNRPSLINLWLRGSETLPIHSFIKALRHYEYYKNRQKKNPIERMFCEFWRFRFRHIQLRYDLHIEPNTLGSGVTLMHPGYRKIPNFVEIGEGATILPMVLLGKAHPHTDAKIVIGKNCYISTGATILAPVKIGNNVTIGAGAVVTKDIPDNAVVGGVPANIISMRNG